MRRSRERMAPRVVRTLALVAVVPAVVAAVVVLGVRQWVSAVAGERLPPAAKDAVSVLLFTVVLPAAVAALVLVVIPLLGG